MAFPWCCFTARRHGASYGGIPAACWRAAAAHVIAVDLPPFGFSDRPGSYTRQDQAARINDVLDALKAAPAIIVGHSFGARGCDRTCDAISGSGARTGTGRCGARIDGGAVGPAPRGDPAAMDSRNPGVADHHQSGGDGNAAQIADREEGARAAGICRDPAKAADAARQHAAISPTGCIISSAPTPMPRARTATPMRSWKSPSRSCGATRIRSRRLSKLSISERCCRRRRS